MNTLALAVAWLLAPPSEASLSLCAADSSASNTLCPKTILYPMQSISANCLNHIRSTTQSCSRDAQADLTIIKKADPKSEEYKNAKARYDKTLGTMDTLMRGFPLEVLYVNRNYKTELAALKKASSEANTAATGGAKTPESPPAGPRDTPPAAPKQPDKPSSNAAADIADDAARQGTEALQEAARLAAEQMRDEDEKKADEIKQKMKLGSDLAAKAGNKTDDALDDSKNAADQWNTGDSGGEGSSGNKNDTGTHQQNSGQSKGSPKTGAISGMGGNKGSATGHRSLGGDSANPKTGQDLLLASMGGYKSSFAGMGLKMGRGTAGEPVVLRSDGMPASSAEVEGLMKQISSEPRALQKRPDFFDVFPRENFNSLKETYKEKPDAKAFKHVGILERRDFEWNQSCDLVSGGCNEYSRQSSYRKGEFISPEDLWSISSVLGGKDEEETGGSSTSLASEKLARGPYANLMKNVLGALGGVMKAVKGGGSTSSSSGSSVWGGGSSWPWNWGSREPVEYSDPGKLKRGPTQMPGLQMNTRNSQNKPMGGLWWLLAAAGAAALWIGIVKKRRDDSPAKPPDEGAG